jgi:hypothetical protein
MQLKKSQVYLFSILYKRWLYRDNLLPANTLFLGYARTKMNAEDILKKTAYQYMKVCVIFMGPAKLQLA